MENDVRRLWPKVIMQTLQLPLLYRQRAAAHLSHSGFPLELLDYPRHHNGF